MAKKINRKKKQGTETRTCDLCSGRGKKFAKGNVKPCPRCHGTGEVIAAKK